MVVRMDEVELPTTITIRIPRKMRELLEEAVQQDTHLNESEFVREAIRKELERKGILKNLQ